MKLPRISSGAKSGIDLTEKPRTVPTAGLEKRNQCILIDRKYEHLRQQLTEKYDRRLAAAKVKKIRKNCSQQQKNESANWKPSQDNIIIDTQWQALIPLTCPFGQGSISITVLQQATYVAAAAIANCGYLMKPHVVKENTNPTANSRAVKTNIFTKPLFRQHAVA
jgi:cell division protein FtsI/penicillin-binding protein 2